MDLKDTIRRLRHLGRTVDLSESSSFVKLADVFLSIERDRLDRAVKLSKKVLSDWGGSELDRFWGVVLKLGRLPGIEDSSDFIGDPSYTRRIQKYMEAANQGATLEAVRVAAESGAGVEMSINKSSQRIILTPSTPINASQKAGALKAARRLSPAKAIVEIGTPESFGSTPIQNAYSPHNYTGTDPSDGLSGRRYVSESYLIATRSNSWQSSESRLAVTDGLPTNLLNGGVWHSQPLSYGRAVTLETELMREPYNKVSFDISRGTWVYAVSVNDKTLTTGTIYGSKNWNNEDIALDFIDPVEDGTNLYISLTNAEQNVNEIFMRGLSVRAEVDDSNRLEWISKGGLKGESSNKLVNESADNLLEGNRWLSSAATSPTHNKDLYLTLSEIPVNVSSLGFNTTTPGCVFEVYYSTDRLRDSYEELNWTKLAGVYELRSERVKVKPFRGCHVLLRFSNLKPMMLRQFDDSLGLINEPK